MSSIHALQSSTSSQRLLQSVQALRHLFYETIRNSGSNEDVRLISEAIMDDVGYLQPMNDQSLDSHVSRAHTRPLHQDVDPCKRHAGLNCCAFRGSLGLQQKEMHACGDLQQYDHYLGFDASLRETQIHGESISDAFLRMKQIAEYSHQIETPLLFNENAGSMASCEDTNDANGYIGHYRQSGEYGNGADFHCTSVSPDVFFSSLVGADEEQVHSPSNVPHPFGETVRQSSSSFMEENCRSNLPLETSSAAVLKQLLNAESGSLYGLSGAQYASHSNRQGSQSYGGISQLQPRLGCASNDGHVIMHSVGSNDFRNLTLLRDPRLRSLRGPQRLSFAISTEKPLRRVADRKRRRDVHSTSIDNSVPAIKPSQSFNESEIRHLEDISTHNTNNLPVVVSAPLGTSSNLVSERKRRKKINEALYALRATVPIVSKMDKVSILKDAIDYTRQLQKHVEDMEDEIRCLQQKAPVGSNTGDVHAACREDLLSISAVRIEQEIDGYCQSLPKQKITEINIMEIKDNTFHLQMCCKRAEGNFLKLSRAVMALDLDVVSMNISSVDDYSTINVVVRKNSGSKDLLTFEGLREMIVQTAERHGLFL